MTLASTISADGMRLRQLDVGALFHAQPSSAHPPRYRLKVMTPYQTKTEPLCRGERVRLTDRDHATYLI